MTYTGTGRSTHSEYICFKTEYKFYWLCLLLINTSVWQPNWRQSTERKKSAKRINDQISIALTSIFRVSGLLFTWRSSAFLSLEFRLLWSQWHYKYVIIPKWIGCYRKKREDKIVDVNWDRELQRRSTTTPTTEKTFIPCWCWCCCCCCYPNTFLYQCKSYIRFPVIVHTEIDLFSSLALLFLFKWKQITQGIVFVCVYNVRIMKMGSFTLPHSRSLPFPVACQISLFYVCLCKTFFFEFRANKK